MRDKAEQARRSNADQTLHVGSVTQVEGDMQRRKAVSPAVSERIPAVAETVRRDCDHASFSTASLCGNGKPRHPIFVSC